MYSRKELSGLSRVSGQPTYRNVQQLAQEYRRMTSSRDNVSSSRGVRDPHASVESGTQFVHDKGPPKHAEPKEIRDATSPSKTYRQRHQGDDLYENARFYRKQAIYNWINSSEQVTQSQCCTASPTNNVTVLPRYTQQYKLIYSTVPPPFFQQQLNCCI